MGWRIYYTITSDTPAQALITRCVGNEERLTIPAAIDGVPVTTLGPQCFCQPTEAMEPVAGIQWFQGEPPVGTVANDRLRHLVLPESVVTLQTKSLADCTALKRLALPESVRSLGERVFQRCRKLERLTLSPNLTELPDYAFADCRSLTELTLPDGVTRVGSQCFYNCTQLKALALPRTVTEIGSGVLMNCARLERLSFPAGINASLLVSDLYQKLIVTVYQDDHATRLLFPEYAYEFEDIVMPRQFRTITYGSGGRYRECIGGNGIDLELYDQLFRVAKLEESPETVTTLALFRLMDGTDLRAPVREGYWAYIRAHLDALAPALIEGDAEAELDFLLEQGNLSPDQLNTLLTCAQQLDHPRFTSRILAMTQPQAATGWADKSFDL